MHAPVGQLPDLRGDPSVRRNLRAPQRKVHTRTLGAAAALAASVGVGAVVATQADAWTTSIHYCHNTYTQTHGCQGGFHDFIDTNSGYASEWNNWPHWKACVEDYAGGRIEADCATHNGQVVSVSQDQYQYTEEWNESSGNANLTGWLYLS